MRSEALGWLGWASVWARKDWHSPQAWTQPPLSVTTAPLALCDHSQPPNPFPRKKLQQFEDKFAKGTKINNAK